MDASALGYAAAAMAAETWTYILECDRVQPVEQQATFTLRPMTVRERTAAERHRDHLVGGEAAREFVRLERERAIGIAIEHVVSVRRFPADSPQPWPLDLRDRLSYLEQLHDDQVLELAREVLRRSRATKGDEQLASLLYARAHIDAARALAGKHLYNCGDCARLGMMQMMGHDGPPTNLWTENLLTDERLRLCPLRTLQLAAETDPDTSEEIGRYLNVYLPSYRDKHLLIAGGIADQPARYIDFILLLQEIGEEVAVKVHSLRPKENQ